MVICNCLNSNYHCNNHIFINLNHTKTVVKVGPVQGCCCTVFQLDLNDTERRLLNFFQDLMAKIIKDTPEEPVPFLIKVLKKMYAEGSSKVQLFLFVSFNLLSINYSIVQMLDDMFLLFYYLLRYCRLLKRYFNKLLDFYIKTSFFC